MQFRSHLRIYFLARTSQVRYLHPRCKKRVDIVIRISVYRFKRIYIYIVDIFQNLYRIQLINKSSLNISRDESASPRLKLQNNFHINHPDS